MKKILHPLFLICIAGAAHAQFQSSFNYSMAVPFKEMGHNINLTHSAVGDVRYQLKNNFEKFWVGMQLGLGVYAITNQEQTYQYSNGSTTQAKVNFTSNIFNGHLIAGLDLLKDRSITPYVVAKGGMSNFYTRIYIPDPNDDDGCKPLENKNVYKDATWSGGLGTGVKIAGNMLLKRKHSDNWCLDFSATYMVGGTVNYLNVSHLMDHNDNTTYDPKGYNISFVNVTTNEIHQHEVAQLHTSRINQLDIKVGILFRL